MFQSRKALAAFVDRLPTFAKPKQRLEQYPTDGDLVAAAVWDAYMRGLLGRVLDLGCGTGRFAVAAAVLGARHVACSGRRRGGRRGGGEGGGWFRLGGLRSGRRRGSPLRAVFDVVFQNPPFGIWSRRGADLTFLESALSLGATVYTIHKLSTLDYVARWAAEREATLRALETAVLNIKPTYRHHRKRLYKVKVFLAAASRQ